MMKIKNNMAEKTLKKGRNILSTSTQLKSMAPTTVTMHENTKENTDTTKSEFTAQTAVTTNEGDENMNDTKKKKKYHEGCKDETIIIIILYSI